jgi:ABC-2 type transport system permease protein
LGLGLTFVFSACNVYLRDLEHILGIITMSMFYVTPILYPISMVPDRLLKVLYINPMTPMVLAFQDVLYYQRAPHLDTLVIVIAYVVIALVAGYFIFQRLQRNFVEEL